EHEDHGDTESVGGLDLLGNGKERTHAEKEGESHVLDKDCLGGEREIVLHEEFLQRTRVGLAASCANSPTGESSSTCSGFLERTTQMKQPMSKNALGASTIRPFGWYHPPSLMGRNTVSPKILPVPKSSRKNPTASKTSA